MSVFRGAGGGGSGGGVGGHVDATLKDSAGNEISFAPVLLAPWDRSAIALSGFDQAIVSVTSLAGGDSLAVEHSLTGAGNWTPLMGLNMATLATLSTITADGKYAFPATGFIRLTKAGPGAAPTVNLLRA